MIKKIDWYIIKKVVSTFLFSIITICSISVVFDISEKLGDFLKDHVTVYQILFEYYPNFVVFIGSMLFPLFTLISVVLVTTKMNQRNEITAILCSGVSFRRLLRPFFISAFIIAALCFVIMHFILPDSNKRRYAFENRVTNYGSVAKDVHVEIRPEMYVSFDSYNFKEKKSVTYFGIDKFEKDSLGNRYLHTAITCDYLYLDSGTNHYELRNYTIREYQDGEFSIRKGNELDTIFDFYPDELGQRNEMIMTMRYQDLLKYRDLEKQKGTSLVPFIEIELYNRTAVPVSLLILTLLGVGISIKPERNNVGSTIIIGILSVACYFVFNRFATVAATNAGLNPFIAVWIPNAILFLFTLIVVRKVAR